MVLTVKRKGAEAVESYGLIQVYTGYGKGKTTAALGLATRAVGHGAKVHIIQFLKGSSYAGELFTVQRLYPELQFTQFGWGCPWSSLIRNGEDKCRKCGQCFEKNRDPSLGIVPQAWNFTKDIMKSGNCDLLILDEISHPLRLNLLNIGKFCDMLKEKPPNLEVVLTGRAMPESVIQLAHLVTEFVPHKHPYQQGITSRRGIEY